MPARPAPPTTDPPAVRAPGLPRPRRGFGAFRPNRAGWVLIGLIALTVAPRAFAAATLGGVCRDAHFYQSLAAHLRAGDLDHGFAYTGLNLFVALAAGLGALAERVGVSSMAAAGAWGVVAAGLTVIPLHDWLRRQFGPRVAVGGCAAFAMHPTLIEVGVEPIREGTFWLCFLAALACLHRAAAPTDPADAGGAGEPAGAPVGPRPVWFLPAGLAGAAAALTRSEGWLLVAPLVGWTALALVRRRGGRWGSVRVRVVAGAVAAALLGPALLTALNLTALHDHARWEWGRPALLAEGAAWAGEAAGLDLAATAPDDDAPAAAPPVKAKAAAVPPAALKAPLPRDPAAKRAERARRRLARAETKARKRAAAHERDKAKHAARREAYAVRRRAAGKTLAGDPLWWGYLDGLVGAFKPALLMLIAGGTLLARRRFLRPDTWPLWCASAGLLGAVWLRLDHHGDLNGRYFLLAGLLALPSAGFALAAAWDALAAVRLPALPGLSARCAPAWAAALLLGGLHLSDALRQTHPRRDRERAAGAALRAELGPAGGAPDVWAFGAAANLADAVGGRTRSSYLHADPAEAAAARPDLVLLPRRGRRGAAYEPDAAAWRSAGFRPLPPTADAALWDEYVALTPVDSPLRETARLADAAAGDNGESSVGRRTAEVTGGAARGVY